MIEGMFVVVNIMLSLMSVMSPPPALCNLSVRTDVKLCIFVVGAVVAVTVMHVLLSVLHVCML